MNITTEERLRRLEHSAEFQLGHSISVQTLLVAALKTINRDPESRAYFTEVLKNAAAGSFDHAIGMTWPDQVIAISRDSMAAIVGKDVAADAGLP